MESMDDLADDVRRRVKDLVDAWKTGKEGILERDLDVEYDDSYPYFSGRPWPGGMAFEGSRGSCSFEFMPYLAATEEGYLRKVLDDAFEEIV